MAEKIDAFELQQFEVVGSHDIVQATKNDSPIVYQLRKETQKKHKL
jgi:hypothetical protein